LSVAHLQELLDRHWLSTAALLKEVTKPVRNLK
jgi:hypothetical protein